VVLPDQLFRAARARATLQHVRHYRCRWQATVGFVSQRAIIPPRWPRLSNENINFNPGRHRFQGSWQTRYAKIGVVLRWDQLVPECARSMAL